jgi:hypothetical protein
VRLGHLLHSHLLRLLVQRSSAEVLVRQIAR